ncbi:MAG: indole-3-glycerol phosphate synthase TrpC [Phycisphaerales bacterium]
MNQPADHLNEPPNNQPNDLPAVLDEIIEYKRLQVREEQSTTPVTELESIARDAEPARDFFAALVESPRHESMAVIAEIKRRSPSAGLIRPEYDRPDFDPAVIAVQYSNAGASAISCLTDQKFFAGDPSYINRIKSAVDLPVIRKDFIIDPYQITQARAIGADAVLLIAECLSDTQIRDFIAHIHDLEMTTLIEIHAEHNLDRILPILESAPTPRILLGINNRDLTKMTTDLNHSIDLLPKTPHPSQTVTESGIRTHQDLMTLKNAGLNIALIGEHLMRTPNPGNALSDLLNP